MSHRGLDHILALRGPAQSCVELAFMVAEGYADLDYRPMSSRPPEWVGFFADTMLATTIGV